VSVLSQLISVDIGYNNNNNNNTLALSPELTIFYYVTDINHSNKLVFNGKIYCR